MTWPDFYLLCLVVGCLWTAASSLLGGFHFGHGGHMHSGGATAAHAHVAPGHAAHPQAHGTKAGTGSWFASLINPSCAAVFLAWFGGVGYLLTRHSGLKFWVDLAVSAAVGLTGAWLLAAFLRFLQSREKALDPADYEMAGVLGRVTSTIRPDGVGELVYVRDGARKPAAARSEDGAEIERGVEVIVTRYEKGVAYVRTWEAMTQRTRVAARRNASAKETGNAE